MIRMRPIARCVAIAVLAAAGAGTGVQAQSARISGLADVHFGTVSAVTDHASSQGVAVCSYRGQPHGLSYSIIANGSGPGGSFELSSGAASLPYDAQWADSPGQTGGTMLQPGIAALGFGNAANGFQCSDQSDTASLSVTIRAADLAAAQAGDYTGLLQITVVPE